MKKIKLGRFIFDDKTKSELEESKVILLKGELVLEADTGFFKVGDGKRIYSELPYLNVGPKGDQGEPATLEVSEKETWIINGTDTGKPARGKEGTSISVKGKADSIANLPKNPKDGDAYLVDGHLHIAYKGVFTDCGNIKGEKGDQGNTGPQGPRGHQGIKGDQGERGPIGPPGFDGKKGDTGATGPTGPQGPQGSTGATGPRGEKGDPLKYEDLTEAQKQELATFVAKDELLKDVVKKKEVKGIIKEVVKKEAIKPLKMTAVIDQTNSNPLTCITYEDDAKMMEKGSAAWDDFFETKLVLFKGGKEVRELQDSELNSLKPEDGDVMAKFKRMGLNIKTVGDKVYVTMTNDPDDPNFKYYAHTRGTERKEAFYLGAYLGYEEAGKLRSIKGYEPTGNKTIGDFRTIAQANGKGYDQLAFYQWTFIQAMFILKYGSLDSQTALGRGLTKNNTFVNTGGTNGKGIDFGTVNGTEQMRFQYLEDAWGNKYQWCDGVQSGGNSDMTTATDNFNNNRTGYNSYPLGFSGNVYQYPKKIQGTSELGFVMKENGASETTYYSDYQDVYGNSAYFAVVGGRRGAGGNAGVFYFYCYCDASLARSDYGARLMFL